MFKLISALALTVAVALPVTANAQAYVTNTATYTGLGDTIGSDFDQVTLGSAFGDYTGPGTYTLNNVSFTVGYNAGGGADYTVSGFLAGSGNVGYDFTYPVAYNLHISSADTITLGGNYVKIGGVGLHINTLTLSAGTGETATGQLTAIAGSVPEPATWGLMLAGFGLVGVAARRRTTVVTA